MKILICYDEEQYLDVLCAHVQDYMGKRFIECEIVRATSPLEVLQQDLRYDLAFLDIQMEGMDGISLAKELKKHNSKLALFFVTNYEEYAIYYMGCPRFVFGVWYKR